MKKTIIISFAVLALASCGGHKSAIEHEIDDYATVTVPVPDLSGISDNGKEVLNLYRFAAQEADNIYWKQYFGDKALIDAIDAPDVKKFALINYGPWNRLDGKTFIEGYSERAAGVNFYPADMTSEEFDSCTLENKESPYTLIKRDSTGLKAVWFHDEYSEEINKISAFLTAAADITIKPSVRNYLLKKIEGLKTDNYYDSDIAWLEMEDSKMDLVIGPNETNDDQFKGIKKSYGALVLLKDLVRTDHLGRYAALIPELQKELPCPEQFKAFADKEVYGCNTATSTFYEETPFHPHLLLRDFICIAYPKLSLGEPKYFKKLHEQVFTIRRRDGTHHRSTLRTESYRWRSTYPRGTGSTYPVPALGGYSS